MGSVLALDQFRQSINEKETSKQKRPRPVIRGSEIWGQDYTDIEAVVFGLLKTRDIVAYHGGNDDLEFDHLCLNALEAAYGVEDTGTPKLKMAIRPLKEWLLDSMTEDNKRDMSWALVILDLIEKSPDAKNDK